MRNTKVFSQEQGNWRSCGVIVALLLLIASPCSSQTTPPDKAPETPWTQYLQKHPGLLEEAGALANKLYAGVRFPAPRSASRLLPLLPQSTTVYAAFPNYGETVHQSLNIFRQELQESSALRDWWQHGELAEAGPKVERGLETFYQLFGYLGDEIVLAASSHSKPPDLLMAAEIRQPGLKLFLQQMLKEFGQPAGVRVFDAQELATAENRPGTQDLIILVRPDFVAMAIDVGTLRMFNARVERASREFALTAFGHRVAQEYEGGLTTLAAADLGNLLKEVPFANEKDKESFEHTGFGDVQYLVMDHKNVDGKGVSLTELSFTRARRGVAAWLAAPAPMGSLDFVSPKAVAAATVILQSPAQVFDDVRDLATTGNPSAFAAVDAMEQMFNLSLKRDVLSQLGGEITTELDGTFPAPAWKLILRVNDAGRLQQSLATLLVAAHFPTEQREEGGVTYYTVRIPSQKTQEIGYAFVDGYLIAASSREAAVEAVRLHRMGESLAKSRRFLASVPPGHSSNASAMFYENPLAVSALMTLWARAPELAVPLGQAAGEAPLVTGWAYGEPTAIRGASLNPAVDAAVILMAAAIAVPNLLRSRMAANEASAVGSIRTVNTAQISYASLYGDRGYAPGLATLGPNPDGTTIASADHASLLDASLAGPTCTPGAWCQKAGYRFSVTATCKGRRCEGYVVTATPVSNDTGVRSFCSTTDAVIRYSTTTALVAPLSAAECRAWTPLD